MNIPYWLYFILIGLLAGWLAGRIMKGHGFGLLGNLIVGVIGAWLGSFLFNVFNLSAYGTLGMIVMATVGAILLLYVVGLVKRL